MLIEMVATAFCDSDSKCDAKAEVRASLGMMRPDDFRKVAAGQLMAGGWWFDPQFEICLCPVHAKEKS